MPTFPTYVHGVDELGTPLNMPTEAAAKPSFEETLARHAPPMPSRDIQADEGFEL